MRISPLYSPAAPKIQPKPDKSLGVSDNISLRTQMIKSKKCCRHLGTLTATGELREPSLPVTPTPPASIISTHSTSQEGTTGPAEGETPTGEANSGMKW